MQQVLMEVKELSRSYRGGENRVEALREVSLSVRSGEFLSVIGPSGSGKSTLMNLLGCLDTPSKGEYRFCGRDVARLSSRELSRVRSEEIGFVFQGFHLIPSLTALENVELPLLYRHVPKGDRRKLAEEALGSVGLENRIHHSPAQMSGGQQQRVAIARAVVGRPSLILADEPTGNLDSQSGQQVMRLLRTQVELGAALVLITHDEALAKTADRVLRLRDGRVTETV